MSPLTFPVGPAPGAAGRTADQPARQWDSLHASALLPDEYDNRPGVFWAYVVAALRRSGVTLPAALPAAQGPEAGHVFVLGLPRRWLPRTRR
jgi:hypothetical protein